MTDKRIELEEVYREWKTSTPEGRAFFESPYNLMVFYQDGVRKFSSVTVENLTLAYRILARIYDFSKDAKPMKSIPPDAPAVGASEAKTPAAEPEPYDETKESGYPARHPLEDGWRWQQRLTGWRENRAQQANRAKLNAAVPTTPHPDTVRRTKSDIRIAAAKLDLYRKRNP